MTRAWQILQPAQRRSGGRGAFTLVEVMISVALVLVLIIGVNRVFKITTDTVSAGQVMSQNIRDTRAAQGVIFKDVESAVMQSPPAFIIASSRVSAFRNHDERLSDRDGAILTIDVDGDNLEGEAAAVVPGELISPATYNARSHRTDRLGFFARGQYRRQTGDVGTFASPTGSSEAYIWYGHLMLPNNTGTYMRPGEGTFATNQNNFVGSSFALGRRTILMRDPNDTNFINAAEVHYNRRPALPDPATGTPVPYNPNLTPFTFGSPPSNDDTNARIQTSRYDLAGITITQFLLDVTEASLGSSRNGAQAANPQWWQRFIYEPIGTGYTAPTAPFPPDRDFRFEADPFFGKPLDSAKAAKLAPILLSGCSQFIVEYAGNYVEQNDDPAAGTAYGDITGITPDTQGTIDYVIDNSSGTAVRRIRWYGMPRDVAGNAKGGPDGAVMPGNAANPSVDVVPLRDVRGVASPFERYVDQELEPLGSATESYLAYSGATPNMHPNARYTCVWGPDIFLSPTAGVAQNNPLPQMLRITFVLDDPNGRLAEGQVYEYVITLPR